MTSPLSSRLEKFMEDQYSSHGRALGHIENAQGIIDFILTECNNDVAFLEEHVGRAMLNSVENVSDVLEGIADALGEEA